MDAQPVGELFRQDASPLNDDVGLVAHGPKLAKRYLQVVRQQGTKFVYLFGRISLSRSLCPCHCLYGC